MQRILHKRIRKTARARRVRTKIRGTSSIPRLHVYRSLRYISAQLIDDTAGKTLVAVSESQLPDSTGTKTQRARRAGELFGAQAVKAGITRVIFERGSYLYHGRVAAFAEGARAAGLHF